VDLTIEPSQSVLSGTKDQLDQIHEHFSFTDKSAENQLQRWKKGLFWKEKALYSEHGELPDDYLKWKKSQEKQLKDNVKVHCCQFLSKNGKDSLIVPTGLLSSLAEYCQKLNIPLHMSDAREFDIGRRLLRGETPVTLRKPQQAALEVITGERFVTHKGLGLVRLATGVGKTALAQELIRHFGLKSIFLVPSLPILKQTIKRFEDAYGKKNVRAYGGGKKDMGYVTVATYQSVFKANPDDFDDVHVVVADECHHVSADTFYDVMTVKLRNAVHRYGLTAFEERADNSTQLIESAVGPVIYQYDAPEAIADGFLARPTFMFYDVYKTRGTWTKYKIKDNKRTAVGDYPSQEYDGDDDLVAYRNWILGNNILNEFVANLTIGFVGEGQSILILVDEKEHGDRLVAMIKGAGIDVGYAIGGGKDNEQLQKDFNARKLKVLIGTSTLGEGADTVPVDVLINLAGGASKSKTLQAVGRGLRNETDENGVAQKPTVLVIDFNFPTCKILTRHSGIREKVCRPMGDVHHSKLT
jgi:superfamily II DNA or RNA helicase